MGETGSELVNRSVRIFWDGVTLGGEPQKVGNEASAFAMKISLLRAQRNQVSVRVYMVDHRDACCAYHPVNFRL